MPGDVTASARGRCAARCLVAGSLLATLVGCAGTQSTFSAFGEAAERTRSLTIWMVVAATLIALGVFLLALHGVRPRRSPLRSETGSALILWLGAVVPTVLLALLLVVALPAMRTPPSAPDDLRIAVTGEQFWWRVRYLPPSGPPVDTANEIRVPVGRTVVFALTSPDVIHSFWVPGLAGKVDMIPGRTNRLVVKATRPGVFRGVCAEFCGLSHARMAFDVVAMEAVAFDRWLQQAAGPAVATVGRGRALFEGYGCGGCHAVRGHGADGAIGPDLTHFGERRSFAAASRAVSGAALADFIRHPADLKPGVLMPAFDFIDGADALALAAYLQALR